MRHRLALCYHAVSPSWPSAYAIRPEQLERQMSYLRRRQFRFSSFSELVEGHDSHRLVAVTFDDAHRSVYELAFPLLRRLGVCATLFVPTRYVDEGDPLVFEGYDEWLGTPFEPELEPMSWDQVRELADAGWQIGAHTRSHPRLTRLEDGALRDELEQPKADVESRLGRPCSALAYPYGDFDHRVCAAARRAGYTAAAALGSAAASPLAWPRHLVMLDHSHAYFRRQVSPLVGGLRATPLWPVAAGVARAGKRAARSMRRAP